jgi:hypothetical protein
MHHIASATIANNTTTSISFSGIPQTFSHLQLRCSVRTLTSSGTHEWLYLYHPNNVTGSGNFTGHMLYSDGGSHYSGGNAANQYSVLTGYIPLASQTSNSFGTVVIDLLDYSNTSKNKTMKSLWGYDVNGAGEVGINSGYSANLGTSALTGFEIGLSGGYYLAQGTKFNLYGLTSTSITGA